MFTAIYRSSQSLIFVTHQTLEPEYNFVLPHRDPLCCAVGAIAVLLHYIFDHQNLLGKHTDWDWSRGSTWHKVWRVTKMMSICHSRHPGYFTLWTQGRRTVQYGYIEKHVPDLPFALHSQVQEDPPLASQGHAIKNGRHGVSNLFLLVFSGS
jgi:hypothetical protein